MSFKHYPLLLLSPSFDSSLTQHVIDLDHLRKKQLRGSTPAHLFFQIKEIFHLLESVNSARIEGNHTTIAEYVESKINPPLSKDEGIKEIENMERALDFIDNNVDDVPLNKMFIAELHKKVVEGLNPELEGCLTPGVYRNHPVAINKSAHTPPDYMQVNDYMDELISFINRDDLPQYDLLKAALVHHRFAWVHPFSNGNGRTVRLLTYAMLVRVGFKIRLNRIINPSAVFCNDRDVYYEKLSLADTGTNEGLTAWCEYVLAGLKEEVKKIDKLTDYDYLYKNILLPALDFCSARKLITDVENKVLKVAIQHPGGFKNSDLQKAFPKRIPADISRLIRQLKARNMLFPLANSKRIYSISLNNNYLLRGVFTALKEKGFLGRGEEI